MTKRTVADKYKGAKSGAGERIMSKARGERSKGKYFRGLALGSDVAAAGSFAAGAAPVGVALLTGGAGSRAVARGASKKAEDGRLKSRGVDALVNKAKTGNTFGFNLKGASGDAVASSGFDAANASFKGRTASGHVDDGTSNHARGTQNVNNMKAIIANRAGRAKSP